MICVDIGVVTSQREGLKLASTSLENHYQASDHITRELTIRIIDLICAITRVKSYRPFVINQKSDESTFVKAACTG